MKILKNAELVSANEFTKIFKYGDIEMYLTKAIDEESATHYMIANIPSIPQLNVSHLKYPFVYTEIEKRDSEFDSFDIYMASDLIENIIKFIEEQQKKQSDENIS